MESLQRLREQIEATEAQLRSLNTQLQAAELGIQAGKHSVTRAANGSGTEAVDQTSSTTRNGIGDVESANAQHNMFATYQKLNQTPGAAWPMSGEEYTRYGRQMIMPEIGMQGQLRLKEAKVLIVGVGGLGCPAAAYLAGAGVGTLGLMDGDTVEVSNLHRQIAHSTEKIGLSKVNSAHEYIRSLNPHVLCHLHEFNLSPEKAIPVFEEYDLVLDCTDHPKSRYLISDACILTGKSLISASALKTEGQLIVLNNPPRAAGDTSGGPCYRCIFPKPPPAESVLSCGEGGILGPVVGVMGVLQALEALKLLTSRRTGQSRQSTKETGNLSESEAVRPSMLIFSAYGTPQFRTVRLRARRTGCASCSADASIAKQALTSGSLDYVAFCGVTTPVNVLPPDLRVSASEFSRLLPDESNMLIDVRDKTQYGLCALRGSINVPWTGNSESWLEKAKQEGVLSDEQRSKFIICRFGNDSQLAAKAIIDRGAASVEIKDIKGGFKSWQQEVDQEWPDY